jgi:hypothetical protein
MPRTDDDHKIVAAAQRAADERKARAAMDPVTACILIDAHLSLGLWRLCKERHCRRARNCRGDMLACGARRWPAVRWHLDRMVKVGPPPPAQQRFEHDLRGWCEEDGVLVQIEQIHVTWG